jgi:glycerate 2-kinase
MNSRTLLEQVFHAAVKAARPDEAVRQAVKTIQPPLGRTVVIGAGKAAAIMAKAFEEAWMGELEGLVVTRYGHAIEQPNRIELIESSHPVPDAASEIAGARMLEKVQNLSRHDLVIVLISGGGSALMVSPNGVTRDEKISINRQLLHSGADITEINTVRKHLSHIKGGRLAIAAAPARVVSLIVSDVVGDDLSTIASGPTVPDPSSLQDAIQILERYNVSSPSARTVLQSGLLETPKPGHPAFNRVENHLIVSNVNALEAAKSQLSQSGFSARIWSDGVTGDAREAARIHAQLARKLEPNSAILSGGETTVRVLGTGLGGRNCEFLLALALELQGEPGIYAMACDTDGIDGVTQAAGAFISPNTLDRALKLGLDPRAMLENNDSYTFFKVLGQLVITGPTGTNVNDFRCIVRQ